MKIGKDKISLHLCKGVPWFGRENTTVKMLPFSNITAEISFIFVIIPHQKQHGYGYTYTIRSCYAWTAFNGKELWAVIVIFVIELVWKRIFL